MMSTLLKLGLSGYDVKPRFGALLEKNFGDTIDIHAKKMNPPSIILGGGGCTVRPAGSLLNTVTSIQNRPLT